MPPLPLTGRDLSLVDVVAVARDAREVGQRGEVAAGADAAARWNDGRHGSVQHRAEQVRDIDPHAREPDGKRVGAQEQHRAHHVPGQWIADPGRV